MKKIFLLILTFFLLIGISFAGPPIYSTDVADVDISTTSNDTELLFNSDNVITGDANLVYDADTDTLELRDTFNIYDSTTPATYSIIKQSDAEGITDTSQLRIGLDATDYRLTILPASLIDIDAGLEAATIPIITISDNTGAYLGHYTAIGFEGNYSYTISAPVATFLQNVDGGGAIFSFSRASGAHVVNSSGLSRFVSITADYDQTGTAGSADLYVNRTETNLGSGEHNFIRCDIDNVQKWGVSHVGKINVVWSNPTQLAANTNNWDLSTFTSHIRLDADGNHNITGIVAEEDGAIIYLVNISANSPVLKDQDANSTAANRIITTTGGDFTMAQDASCTLIYDSTTARWRQQN